MQKKPALLVYRIVPALLLALLIATHAVAEEARIAISTFQINAGEDLDYLQSGLKSLLPPRISLPGKIFVVDTAEVRSALSPPRSDYSIEKKAGLASALKLDYLLTGSITKIGDGISIDAFLYDAAKPEHSGPLSVSCSGLDNMLEKVQELSSQLQRRIIRGSFPELTSPPDTEEADAPRKAERRRPVPVAERKRAPVMSLPRSAPVFAPAPVREYVITHKPFVCMAAGDLTGQGRNQLLLADHLDVRVYEPEPGELRHSATIPTTTGEYILHVDTFDLNDNGREEIYISSFKKTRANSFIAEYVDDGSYKRIAQKQPWFLRAYPADNGWILLGVEPGTFNPFFGSAFEFIWKDGSAQPGAEYPLPSGVSPFGSSRSDLTGNQRAEYVAFSRGVFGLKYILHVISSTGKILWKDQQDLGGTPNTFPLAMVGDGMDADETIPLRVHCSDINGDSRADILLPNNTKKSGGFLRRLGSYNQGEMLCMHWDGTSLSQNWSSGIMDGYISDFLVTDIDNDDLQELLVLWVTDQSFSGKASNIVRVYKQSER